jgi:hypothetical protein
MELVLLFAVLGTGVAGILLALYGRHAYEQRLARGLPAADHP